MDETVRRLGSGVVASIVSSESATGLRVPAVKETLTRIPDQADTLVDTWPASLSPGPPTSESAARVGPVSGRRGSAALRTLLLGADIAVAAGAWLALSGVSMSYATNGRRWGSAIAATFVTLVAMQFLGLYRSRFCVQRAQEMARIVFAVFAGSVAFVLVKGTGVGSHGAPVVVGSFCALALIVSRWIFGQWLCAQRARGRFLRGIVMIGANEDAGELLTMLRSQPELGYEVRAIIGETQSGPDWADLPRARSLDELPSIARQTHATGVLILANALSSVEVNRVIKLCARDNLHVQVCPGFRGLAMRRVRRLPMSGEVFLYVEPGRRPTWQLVAKRMLDVLGAAVGLLIATPILLIAWVAIRLEDNGPTLYRQVRIGLNEQPFVVYKLRSMVLDADKAVNLAVDNERTDGPLFKSVHDPRVTRVGAILRALSIDELPQLFNVLTGTMSLVGPRPALAEEVAQFDPELLRRHNLKPGITGLWQIEARDNPSFHAYRRLDLFYVENWSIGLDLAILLVTMPMLITHVLRMHQPGEAAQKTPSEA